MLRRRFEFAAVPSDVRQWLCLSPFVLPQRCRGCASRKREAQPQES